MSKSKVKILLFLFIASYILMPIKDVFAGALSDGQVILQDPRTSETSQFTFDLSSFTTATAINCIELTFNTQADELGSVPNAMDTTAATLVSSDIITPVNWTVNNATNGTLELTYNAGEVPSSSGEIVFGNIDNSDTESTYYANLRTYANVDCSTGGAIDYATLAFSINDGELVELTVGQLMTFACLNVSAGQSVNGSTTTHASTATGIDFENDVSAVTNGISAHDLEVSTNSAGGYVIYIRHTGALTSFSNTINNHAGTNVTPTSFSAVGTESWGYTTNDSTLSGGTADRFTNPGNYWAGFSTNNEPVAYNPVASPTPETTRVGHQVGISSNTEAGTYQTTIIYTLVATF